MRKTMRIGTMKIGQRAANIFIKAEFKEGKFSMSGVIGPLASGNCRGGCGQIDMEFAHRNPKDNDDRYNEPVKPEDITFAPGWDREKWLDLLDVWGRWHLNNMKASCEHQRAWDTREKVEVIEWNWGDKFHAMRRKAEDGLLSAEEYEEYKTISAEVLQVTIKSRIKWLSPLAEKLLADGWIKEGKRETKTAGWITESEHPKGLLSKVCEVCGYKYGSAWLKEDVPQNVINFVQGLPDADIVPAWI